MFSNFAVGLTVGGVTTPDPLLIRAPGVNNGVPGAWSATAFSAASQAHPDYSMSALTHWVPTTGGFTTPRFGGISTGGEVMPSVDASGHLQMSTSNWFMISISVDSAAHGALGSIIEQQTASGRDASGDILSYYAIGSLGINSAYIDKTWVESSRDQLKLDLVPPVPPPQPPPPPRSIQNFDYGMGIISIDPQGRAGSMFPVRDCFYFTLTKSWLNSVPSFSLGGQTANASTIYVMKWTATQVPPWSVPAIAFSHDDLFDETEAHVGEVEIDALSIDRGNGGWDQPNRAVFSLTPESDAVGPFDQILVFQRYTTVEAVPLSTDPAVAASETISHKFGLVPAVGDPSNVTGTCGGDPVERYRIYPVVAIATDKLKAGAGTLGFSGVRTCQHATPPSNSDERAQEDTLHLQITGMNYGNHMFGVVQLYTESDAVDPGQTPGPTTPWGSPILIDSAATLRNTIELACPVPCALSHKVFRCSAELAGLDFPSGGGMTVTSLRTTCVLSIEN